mmetsp:Transcript_23253/g.51029  ORF Transcript_23253/g.51029 Transcript_23253/m.51029 type:complete len:213 (-) Transcript_23253:458-1096(-)
MQDALTVDQGVAADSPPRAIWKSADHLELDSLVGKLVVYFQKQVLVPCEVRLEVVVEDIILVRGRQGVLERDDMDLFEGRRGVPICKDQRVAVHHSNLCLRLNSEDLELSVEDFDHLAHADDAHQVLARPTVEVGTDVLFEELVGVQLARLFIIPQANKLHLRKSFYGVPIYKVVCFRTQKSLVRIGTHHDEVVSTGALQGCSDPNDFLAVS